MNRNKIIIRTSVICILSNIVLSIFKAIIGIISNSIAITLDAINNLSDALSSIITITGTKLAEKQPDKKHPFGYGRIEYLSALIVSGIILYAGITSLVESIKKIISPKIPNYDNVSLLIIFTSIIVKIILGKYVKKQGEKVNSTSLFASGSDALFDAILSTSVLISAIIFILTNLSLEAYVGSIISIIIIKSGISIMTETTNEILGMRTNKEITDEIKQILKSEPKVRGAYDLIIHNYGPNKYLASVHLELPDKMIAKEIDILSRKLSAKVYEKTGITLVGIGLYSYNTENNKMTDIQKYIEKKVLEYNWVVQIHGFYLDIETKEIYFDIVLNFDIKPKEAINIIYNEISKTYPEYKIYIKPDIDASTT